MFIKIISRSSVIMGAIDQVLTVTDMPLGLMKISINCSLRLFSSQMFQKKGGISVLQTTRFSLAVL